MFSAFKRIIKTAIKDILRNGSIALSSISVMTLVFLILTIFVFFAYTAAKFLHYIETREHLEVFFNPNVDQNKVFEIKKNLELTGKTLYVSYTSQSDAVKFMKEKYKNNPLILEEISEDSLPSSLAIRAKKIEYVPELKSLLEKQDPEKKLIFKISYNEDTTNLLKDLLIWVRVIGGILFVFLILTVFLVSLITVEISISMRREEILIMQLVGGGKWYIRAPFILEGGFFGAAGAFFAFLFIAVFGAIYFFVKDQSPTLSFISNFFSEINIPKISITKLLLFLVIEVFLGYLIGSLNSLFAVFRKLK